MFTDFYYILKAKGVPVSMNEWYSLLDALEMGLAGASLTGFYHLARAVLVKTEAHYDRFDLAFAQYFEGIETPEDLPYSIWDWLDKNLPAMEITEAMRRAHKQLDLETLKKMLEERLAEQNEEHHGGNHWVGTGGTSPFGHSGYHPGGIRIGGESRNRSAVKVAGDRQFRDFRNDTVLDTRQFQLALRKLRQFSTRLEGARTELDVEGTVQATSKNAGRLEIVWDRPRENTIKVLLLMDSGGSMYPYMRLSSQLFTAAQKSKHFKDLQVYYFHNTIYDLLYLDPRCRASQSVETDHVLKNLDGEYRVILVGDASMAPTELLAQGGIINWGLFNEEPGVAWLKKLKRHFEASVWLNPIPGRYWEITEGAETIHIIKEIFPMFELTVEGLDMAVKKLRARK
ncbi:MAG: VWA domain-containing protein [Syntrophomonadaceae bacterium]|nr:VWA domain-containing protein [Syntrophomonadaceae bacterium]